MARDVLRQTVIMAGVGVGVGTAGALLASRLLRSIVYGVSTHDPVTYLVTCALLFATGLLAGYVPARRAARIDPVSALRYD